MSKLPAVPAYLAPCLPSGLIEALPRELEEHCGRFLAYVLPYTDREEDGPVWIKVEHSFMVLSHVAALVEAHGRKGLMGSPAARAALLAALYHDCGRFPQFRQYGTFQDAASVNHGLLGLRTIRGQGFLKDEDKKVQALARTAVLLHNRHTLPGRMDPEATLITNMVRDADKLDIMRVMALHLSGFLPGKDTVVLNVKDEPERYSSSILQDVLNRRVPRYSDLRYINDFRLLLGTWVHEMAFFGTRRELRERGWLSVIWSGLPDTSEIRKAREIIFSVLLGQDEESAAPAAPVKS